MNYTVSSALNPRYGGVLLYRRGFFTLICSSHSGQEHIRRALSEVDGERMALNGGTPF